jgi:hypothetical protein
MSSRSIGITWILSHNHSGDPILGEEASKRCSCWTLLKVNNALGNIHLGSPTVPTIRQSTATSASVEPLIPFPLTCAMAIQERSKAISLPHSGQVPSLNFGARSQTLSILQKLHGRGLLGGWGSEFCARSGVRGLEVPERLTYY